MTYLYFPRAALDYLRTIFGALVLSNQDCFRSTEGYEELLKAIPDSRVVGTMRTKWATSPSRSSKDKWNDLLKQAQKAQSVSAHSIYFVYWLLTPDSRRAAPIQNLMAALEDVILQYTYPRLDAEVSKHRNHLLKAPFCVHPKTGRVCVPLDLATIDNFDPESVPTVGRLLRELDGFVRDNEDSKEFHSGRPYHSLLSPFPFLKACFVDWKKTSLKPYIDLLDRHALSLMETTRYEKRKTGQFPRDFCPLNISHNVS